MKKKSQIDLKFRIFPDGWDIKKKKKIGQEMSITVEKIIWSNRCRV